MRLINLTPHTISLVYDTAGGEARVTLEPAGLARLGFDVAEVTP